MSDFVRHFALIAHPLVHGFFYRLRTGQLNPIVDYVLDTMYPSNMSGHGHHAVFTVIGLLIGCVSFVFAGVSFSLVSREKYLIT